MVLYTIPSKASIQGLLWICYLLENQNNTYRLLRITATETIKTVKTAGTKKPIITPVTIGPEMTKKWPVCIKIRQRGLNTERPRRSNNRNVSQVKRNGPSKTKRFVSTKIKKTYYKLIFVIIVLQPY